VSAEFMLTTVSMLANAVSQPLDLSDELLPCHLSKICIHDFFPEQ
jgi:hypothetical protein